MATRTISSLVTDNCTPGCTSRDAALAVVTATRAAICTVDAVSTNDVTIGGNSVRLLLRGEIVIDSAAPVPAGGVGYGVEVTQPAGTVIRDAYVVVTETVGFSNTTNLGQTRIATTKANTGAANTPPADIAFTNNNDTIISNGLGRTAGYATFSNGTNLSSYAGPTSANSLYTTKERALYLQVYNATSGVSVTTPGKLVFVVVVDVVDRA